MAPIAERIGVNIAKYEKGLMSNHVEPQETINSGVDSR